MRLVPTAHTSVLAAPATPAPRLSYRASRNGGYRPLTRVNA